MFAWRWRQKATVYSASGSSKTWVIEKYKIQFILLRKVIRIMFSSTLTLTAYLYSIRGHRTRLSLRSIYIYIYIHIVMVPLEILSWVYFQSCRVCGLSLFWSLYVYICSVYSAKKSLSSLNLANSYLLKADTRGYCLNVLQILHVIINYVL